MQEWIDRDKFNSFNSWKGLLYADWYKAIIKGKFLPPIEASIDPYYLCNLKCQHCNSHRDMTGDRIPDSHLLKLVRFLGDWGVKAACFAGGGEPLLHTAMHDAVVEARLVGMEAAILTNGTLLKGKMLDALQLCRWVGVSVDAATPETYLKLKGVDKFKDVISNLARAVKKPGDCDIAFKFLISSINQGEIFSACKLAKEMGVRDFHARPMDFHHQGMGKDLDGRLANIDIDLINYELECCHSLENENFHVFTIIHKFNPDFTPKRNFSQCYAAPLLIQLGANGKVYFCVDQKHGEGFEMGSHYPNPESILDFWGKERHRYMVLEQGIPSICKTRCTFGVYCEQCELLFTSENDPMCWRFT